VQDKRGRDILTVIAYPIDEMEAANQAAQNISNEDAVLRALHDNPKLSLAEMARQLGWVNEDKPERWRVQRALKALDQAKLVRKFRGKYGVTDAGEKALKES
jgi:hypothetical protein